MTKPQITIHIDGRAGAGKSPLARHLATYLKIVHGVSVTLQDDGERQAVPDVHNPLTHFDADVTISVEQK